MTTTAAPRKRSKQRTPKPLQAGETVTVGRHTAYVHAASDARGNDFIAAIYKDGQFARYHAWERSLRDTLARLDAR